MYRLIYFIPIWLLFLLIKIPTGILGYIAIPLMWRYRRTPYRKLPSWTRPWANPEDWEGGPQGHLNSLPEWWVEDKGHGFVSFYQYHAFRNPANGLRSFEWLDLDIDASKVRYVTPQIYTYYAPWSIRPMKTKPQTVWYLCWQGLQAGFKFVHLWNDDRHMVVKIGWRIKPTDKFREINPEGIRATDSGFATKFLFYRKG